MFRLLLLALVTVCSLAFADSKVPPPPKKPLTFGMSHPYGDEQAQKAKALI